MSQGVYERPREKLQHRGVGFLTVAELLQVVIGSGTGVVSGAQLARRVAKLMEKQEVAYESLRAIKGLGHAKSCQLLAAIELGRRYDSLLQEGDTREKSVDDMLAEWYAVALKNGRANITCFWLNGSDTQQGQVVYKEGLTTALVRRIMSDAVAASAHGIVVFLPFTGHSIGAQEMAFIRSIYEASRYLHISLKEVAGFHRKGYERWKKEVL